MLFARFDICSLILLLPDAAMHSAELKDAAPRQAAICHVDARHDDSFTSLLLIAAPLMPPHAEFATSLSMLAFAMSPAFYAACLRAFPL